MFFISFIVINRRQTKFLILRKSTDNFFHLKFGYYVTIINNKFPMFSLKKLYYCNIKVLYNFADFISM